MRKILDPYTVRIKTTRSDLKGRIRFNGNAYEIKSDEFTEIMIPYTDVQVGVDVLKGESEETILGTDFDIRSHGDVFWMILSLTSEGYFEFKRNEPLEILESVLIDKE